MAYAHSINIFHQDLKAENIFLTPNGSVKIADFGISKTVASVDGSEQFYTAGTLTYMAPEYFLRKGAGYSSDVWAVGLIIHALMTGSETFAAATDSEIEAKVLKHDPGRLPQGVYSLALRELVWRMTRKSADERPTAV